MSRLETFGLAQSAKPSRARFTRPSKANEAAFERAVEEVAASAEVLIGSLVTKAQSRTREVEAAKAKERSALRFRRVGNDS
jgi:hypothetical protein